MIEIESGPDSRFICHPVGDLDQYTAGSLHRAVGRLPVPVNDLVIDLRDVEFVDAAGVAAIVGAIRLVRAVGGAAWVCNAGGPVQWRLQLVGMKSTYMPSSSWPGAA
jgi:anti-anti-sigma factor